MLPGYPTQQFSAGMAFTFEYVGLTARDFGCGTWGDQQWALLGRLTAGQVQLNDPILLPTKTGGVVGGYVVRFAESFSEWCGLPFYNRLTPEMMPDAFCLCVGGLPADSPIICPGVARSAE